MKNWHNCDELVNAALEQEQETEKVTNPHQSIKLIKAVHHSKGKEQVVVVSREQTEGNFHSVQTVEGIILVNVVWGLEIVSVVRSWAILAAIFQKCCKSVENVE